MGLPGLLSERLFVVLDVDKDEYLSKQEFVEGLLILFQDIITEGTRLAFRLLDFDADGEVSLADMMTLLSHVPTVDLTTDPSPASKDSQAGTEDCCTHLL